MATHTTPAAKPKRTAKARRAVPAASLPVIHTNIAPAMNTMPPPFLAGSRQSAESGYVLAGKVTAQA